MEIIFIPKDISEELMNYPIEDLNSDSLEVIKEDLRSLDEKYKLKEVNLGTGADWILILTVINSITAVFLLGEKIDKGIEGWVNLGKRIKTLFTKTDLMYIDKTAAQLLAFQYLSKKYKLKTISLEKEFTEEILNLSTMLLDRKPNDFISKPYAIYYFTFQINDDIITLLSIRSDGEINELYSFDIYRGHPF